jgi:hypothetical protein
MIISRNHTFHDAATVAADGTDMDVAGLATVSVQISGTSTSRTVLFKSSVDNTNFLDIMGMDIATLSPSVSTTDTGKIFMFDVRGISKLRMDISAVAGGNITIKGLGIK